MCERAPKFMPMDTQMEWVPLGGHVLTQDEMDALHIALESGGEGRIRKQMQAKFRQMEERLYFGRPVTDVTVVDSYAVSDAPQLPEGKPDGRQ